MIPENALKLHTWPLFFHGTRGKVLQQLWNLRSVVHIVTKEDNGQVVAAGDDDALGQGFLEERGLTMEVADTQDRTGVGP